MAPKQFELGVGWGGGDREIKMKIKWRGAVEEQLSCERKLGSDPREFRTHLKHMK